jgi:hypothetical protein
VKATEIDLEDFVWSGRRAWVGPVLPAQPEAGDVWLDVCELVPMLLLPREPPEDPSEYAPGALERLTPFVAWLSLRPVARWQLAAFMSLAGRALDPERLLAGDEAAPVTSIRPAETARYAGWFWKGLGGRRDWEAARDALTREELAALWGPLRREWDGVGSDGIHSVVTPETVDVDPDEAYDEGDPDGIIHDESEAPDDVGFRTHINTQIGLSPSGGAGVNRD